MLEFLIAKAFRKQTAGKGGAGPARSRTVTAIIAGNETVSPLDRLNLQTKPSSCLVYGLQ